MKKILLVIVTFVATAPAIALAQQGQVRESVPAAPYLATAYVFMWLAVLVYVALVARRITRVQSDIEDLKRKLENDRP